MSERHFFSFWKRIDGQPARLADGSHFCSSQGEFWQLHHRNYSCGEAVMFIIQVDDGTWLADTTAYRDEPRYTTRELALKAAAENVAEKCRLQLKWKAEWHSNYMSTDQANFISAWAFKIANEPPPAPLIEPPKPERKGQMGLFA